MVVTGSWDKTVRVRVRVRVRVAVTAIPAPTPTPTPTATATATQVAVWDLRASRRAHEIVLPDKVRVRVRVIGLGP
jgi:hypothetical protein